MEKGFRLWKLMYNGENDMQSRKILQDCDYTKVCFIPYSTQAPNPTNCHESTNILTRV